MREKNIFNSKSIAVLPFRNIGKDENEYFSDGITEEIINALTKIDGLKVTARTSSFFYKNKPLDARLIGNELGVESLLEGSVRIINDRVRITAQLIRTDNGFHIWSENFDRNISDIFELQDEISHKIAEKVRENYGHFVIEDQLSEIGTKSVDAYKFFLKGRAHQLNWHLEDINKAISFYEQSIEIDPNFSDALIAIGWCYGILASWKYINRKEGLILAEEYLNKGVALAPNSATGFYGKATISFWGHWDFKKSLMQLEKSLELNPKLTEAHEAMAEVYTALGEFDRAKSSINLALEINPLSPNHYYTKANIYYLQQQFSKALISLDASLKIDSSFILSIELKTACQILQGDLANFKKHLKQSPQLERPRLCEQIFNLLKGSQVIKIENLEDKNNDVYIENSHLPWSFYLKIYQKEYNEALNILKENTELPTGQYVNFANDPLIEPLRDHQEYNDIKSSVFKGDFLPELNSIKEKIVHSPFEDEELKNFAFQLECAMKEDKGFVNPELSLKQLASNIQLHPNKLSWLLNNHFGKNFNDYVNQYRIKEFQQLALKPENQHITLLGLAYDSGFNSKTVFNTFFKKETGMTPKQWLKSNN